MAEEAPRAHVRVMNTRVDGVSLRIAVVGTGAVGGVFGLRLALSGQDVHFIARGRQLEAMRTRGLRVEGVAGDALLRHPNVTEHPEEVGVADVVLLAVKRWDLDSAAQRCLPLVGAHTRVITLQNGVDSAEHVSPILGAEQTIPGIAYVFAVLREPGVISQSATLQGITCGRLDGRADAMLASFAAAGASAGLTVNVSDDIELERWKKFCFLAATSGSTALTRMPLGPILRDPDTRALFEGTLREAVAVARAKGLALDEAFITERMSFSSTKLGEDASSSLANDLMRGHPLEVDWLAGQLSRLGRTLGVPTPLNDTIYAALKLHRRGADRAPTA
jgi:2-dehydropantoate 2-reductase